MSEVEETPSQRQARLRREKREAKIRSGGQERLEKITKLSGRTPESMKDFDSPVATPPRTASPAMSPPIPPAMATADPDQLRQQEEFIRAMLRSQASQPQQQPQPQPQQQQGLGQMFGQGQDTEDPMVKMLASMLGGMGGDPNAPASDFPSLNPDDIAKATGLPSFVTNMMMGKQEQPASPAELKQARIWQVLRVVFAFLAGIYMLMTVNKLTSTFGDNPPAPATVQNPFVIFVTFELLLHGLRPFLASGPKRGGPMVWLQTAKEIGRDGAVMVFMMGAYSWWHGLA